MSEDEGRTFLSRWSRRKIAARQADPAGPEVPPAGTARAEPPPPVAVPGAGDPQDARPPEASRPLPDLETLQGLESEYRDFLQPGVDQSLRRAALKKLFADPHFNVMDGLDVYIDDYSKPDPIPQALLRSLNQARGLKLFEEEQAAEDVAEQQTGQPPAGGAEGESSEAVTASVTDCPGETEMPDSGPEAADEGRKTG